MAEYVVHIVETSRGGVFGHAESDRESDDAGTASCASDENDRGLAEEEIRRRGGRAADAAQASHNGLQ